MPGWKRWRVWTGDALAQTIQEVNSCIAKPGKGDWKPKPFSGWPRLNTSMKIVLHSFAYCLDYLREQVADLGSGEIVAQPDGIINHPAWVIGHLTVSCQALGGEIGLREWLPTDWPRKYGTNSTPVPDASAYADKNELLRSLADAQTRITAAVEQLSDDQLDQTLPDENYRILLPTVRHAITQVLVAHPANHIGQITLWRRAMGLSQMMRPFA